MALSLETIDYQHKDSFPIALERIIDDLYDGLTSNKYSNTEQLIKKHPAAKLISPLIKDRFNMDVELTDNLYVLAPAAVIPFFGDYYRHDVKQQGFLDLFKFNGLGMVESIEKIVKDRKATLKKIHGKTGFVNTKLARVGGYLAEVRHYLIVDFKWLQETGITSKEAVAIILHEIGHAFDGLEEHYRLETTNRAILDILTDLNDNKPDAAIYRFKKTFNRADFENAQLSGEKERQDFCGELAREYIGTVQSQLQSGKYDSTNFENMADAFATRFGMGKYLVSALHKLMSTHGYVREDSLTTRVIYYTIDVMFIMAMFLVFPTYGVIVYLVCIAYLTNTSNADMTYDEPIERYQRIRNTVVNALKKVDLPKDIVKDLLEQLDYIETTIKNSVHLKGVATVVGDIVFSDARRDKYYIDLQRRIEDSLNNSLFVKSAQLRTS